MSTEPSKELLTALAFLKQMDSPVKKRNPTLRESVAAELEQIARQYDDDGPLASEWGHRTIAKHLRDVAKKLADQGEE